MNSLQFYYAHTVLGISSIVQPAWVRSTYRLHGHSEKQIDCLFFCDHLYRTEGKILIKDRIADNMFQQVLTRPNEYDVVAMPNLNGDYMSDACAAQVGGLGVAPGGNIGDYLAVFEATHGTAPKYAGQDKVNPGSVILSGVMMFQYIGWNEAADLTVKAMEKTVLNKTVTYDLERQMDGATLLKCSEYGEAIVENMDKVLSD